MHIRAFLKQSSKVSICFYTLYISYLALYMLLSQRRRSYDVSSYHVDLNWINYLIYDRHKTSKVILPLGKWFNFRETHLRLSDSAGCFFSPLNFKLTPMSARTGRTQRRKAHIRMDSASNYDFVLRMR